MRSIRSTRGSSTSSTRAGGWRRKKNNPLNAEVAEATQRDAVETFAFSAQPPRPLRKRFDFLEGHMRLENKVGIVTAAASGMGRAGALRFAKEGAAVGVADIDEAGVNAVVQEITAAGGRALALVGDLRTD